MCVYRPAFELSLIMGGILLTSAWLQIGQRLVYTLIMVSNCSECGGVNCSMCVSSLVCVRGTPHRFRMFVSVSQNRWGI